jgi:hypothetical protein
MNPKEVRMAYPRIGLALLGFLGGVLVTTSVRAEQKEKKDGALPPFPDPGQPGMNDSEFAMEADAQRSDETTEKEIMARYGKGAKQSVKRTMQKRKKGSLRSGRSGKKVKSRKQAIAIGLSEARRKGKKVPPK